MSGRDTLTYNRTAGILAQVNHLRTGIRLLVVVCHSYGIEFGCRVVTCQDAGRIFPGNCRTGFHLCPGQFAVYPFAVATFRHEVIYTALALGITRIPVLDSAVFHFGAVVHDNLHNSGMQLVFITHRCRTTFQVRNVRVIIRHNQRTFKLSRIAGIDTEIGRKFHRTAHTLRDIYERTVREHCGVQRSKEIVTVAYYRPHVFLHQIRMLPHRFAERAENNPLLHQCLLEGGLYGNGVHHGIHRHSAKSHLFFQRDSQLIKCFYQLRVYFFHALRPFFLLCRVSIVGNCLIINLRNTEMCPSRHLQRQPIAVRLQAELQQPFRFVLFR